MAEYNELLEDLKTIVSDEIKNQWKKYCERRECHLDGLFRWDFKNENQADSFIKTLQANPEFRTCLELLIAEHADNAEYER